MVREYRYAMYNRPVWGGLSLSQPYTIDFELTHPDIVENRRYYNRDAHSILITNHPLTADEIRNLEMVDIAADNKQRANKAKLVEYVNTLDGVSDSGKSALVDMVKSGKYVKNKADVDKWADKLRSQDKRAEQRAAAARRMAAPKPKKPPATKNRPQILPHGFKGEEPIYANFTTSTDVSYKGKIYREKYRYRFGSLLSARDELVLLSATDVYSIVIDFGEAAGISRYAVFCTTPRTYAPAATKKPAPTPSVPPVLTAPPELAADVLGTGPTQAAPGRKPAVKDRVKMHDGEWAHITEVRTDEVRVKPDGLSHVQVLIYTDMLHKVAYRPDPIANMSFYWQVRARKTAAAPKRKPAARTTRKPAAKPAAKPKKQPAKPKTTKKPAAPKARKPKKTTAAKTRKTTKKTAKPKAKKTTTPKLTASQREYLAIHGFVMVKRGGKYVRITG